MIVRPDTCKKGIRTSIEVRLATEEVNLIHINCEDCCAVPSAYTVPLHLHSFTYIAYLSPILSDSSKKRRPRTYNPAESDISIRINLNKFVKCRCVLCLSTVRSVAA